MTPPSILIFYLSVGSGHEIAARSIADALLIENPDIQVSVVDPFSEAIDILPLILEKLQAASILITPRIYDSAWRLSSGGFFEWITDLNLLQDLIIEQIEKTNAKIIISTHVLPCAISTIVKQNLQDLMIYGVATDYGLHSLWPITDLVNGYYVGHEELKNILVYRGIEPDKVLVSGIPINTKFSKLTISTSDNPCTLIHQKLRVLLVIGGLRSGSYVNIQKYVGELLEKLDKLSEYVTLTIVTGNQTQLLEQIKDFSQHSSLEIKALGFVEDMHLLMTSNDILISKPGGLLVAEALASGICPILLPPGPGQETINEEFLSRHNIAFAGRTPDQIISALKYCIEFPDQLIQKKNNSKSLGIPNSALKIAQHILSLLDRLRNSP